MTSILSLKGKSMNICMSGYSYLLLIIILSVPNYFLSAEKAPEAAYIRLRGTAAQTKSADFSNPFWEKGNKAEGSTFGGGLLLSGVLSPPLHLTLGFSIDRREEKYSVFEIEHSIIKNSLAASYYFYDDSYLSIAYSTLDGYYRDFKGTTGRSIVGTAYDLSLWLLLTRQIVQEPSSSQTSFPI